MQLIIAEKPSVAQAIAKVLDAKQRKDGYIEDSNYIVSWCIGHLVELASADVYDSKYSKWLREDLPIIPKQWEFIVSSGTKKQFDVLKMLMKRSDVTEIVCATDAGREGELIFRLVYNQCKCDKPFKRLWISSMEDEAIRKGFLNLLPSSNFDNLYNSALCRMQADWLIGINATRLFTTLYHGKILNIGRVMTPALSILVEREKSIAEFKKTKFYTVDIDCNFFNVTSEKMQSKSDAEKLRKNCIGKTAVISSIVNQQKIEKPPKLYDLTTLQREANRIYGYTAKQTLDYIQSLYEKKLVTYPRTDSQYLTEEMATILPDICKSALNILSNMPDCCSKIEVNKVIDNSKVSDHHAIILTKQTKNIDISALPSGERTILNLICLKLLCAVNSENYIYSDMSVIMKCDDVAFTTKAKLEVNVGWKEIERAFFSKKQSSVSTDLSNLSEGQSILIKSAKVCETITSPPKRYTEDTLLSAMENAASDDFVQIEDAEHKGIGTPATRAGVIEKLVKVGYVERKSKQLIPTQKGIELIKIMPDTIKSAKMTAEWESALKQVENGKLQADKFLDDIIKLTADIIKIYDSIEVGVNSILSASSKEVIGLCPRCGRNIYEGKTSFYCSGYKEKPPCGFILLKNNKYFKSKRVELTKEIVSSLLKDGRVNMTGLYSEKKDVVYDAAIILDDTGDKYINFKLEFDKHKNEQK